MWDLFAQYGFSEEYSRQESRSEHVAHFPLLNDMEEEDAKWLAYAMLRRAGLDGEDTLVVMPQDDSGTVHLESAYEESLDVAAIRIRRELVAASQTTGCDHGCRQRRTDPRDQQVGGVQRRTRPPHR